MMESNFGLLKFKEGYFERIWGGRRLASAYGKVLPDAAPIGEAWLVSDHPRQGSVVVGGEHQGRTLRSLMEESSDSILGTHAKATAYGRFPLLLKILDARDKLSVQVHPNDDDAARLGEDDSGKTEMWHVLDGGDGGEIICGLKADVSKESLECAIREGRVADLVKRVDASSGMSVFIPAGTVHAIGRGVMLAEIQQNSDVTYRVYDWGRVQADGTMRELHIDKALEVIRFGEEHQGPTPGLRFGDAPAQRTLLVACKYFAAERIDLGSAANEISRDTRSASFHLLLSISGSVEVEAAGDAQVLAPGQAVMVCGSAPGFELRGQGSVLDYYVPDIQKDVLDPLRSARHSAHDIARLGIELI